MKVQHSSAHAQRTGWDERRGHGEKDQSQQLEDARGKQHVATIDQHRHGQHHVGQQPAEECHPGEPGPREGWPRHLYLEGSRWRLRDPKIPQRCDIGISALGFPTEYHGDWHHLPHRNCNIRRGRGGSGGAGRERWLETLFLGLEQ